MSPGRDERPLVVHLGEWHRRVGERVEFEATLAAGELADELAISSSHVEPGDPIEVRAGLEILSAGVMVIGEACTAWHGTCRRCLEPAAGELVAAFAELCVASPDDDSTYPVGATEIDLEALVHDACILELPLAPLCKADCLGLCPECGVDRNRERCECEPAPDGRWAALASLYDEAGSAERGRSPES